VGPRARISAFWVLLVVVTLGGLALRVGYVAIDRWDFVPEGDAQYYHETANHLADGRGLVNPFLHPDLVLPAADHPPLYTVYLAAFSVVGLDTPNAHMLASALLGGATVLLAGLTGRRMGGDRVGILAAALVAVYPNVWRHDGMLMSETLAVFATVLAVWLTYRYLDRPSPVAMGLVGAAVGLGTLARSELILLAPLLVVPMLLVTTDRPLAERLRWLAAAAAACVVVIAPWVIRNWVQLDRPMLSSQLEVTLATANCDSTYHGDLVGYWDFACAGPILDDAGVETPADPDFDRVLGEAARDYVGDNLAEVPRVMTIRLGRTLTLYRPGQQIQLDTFGEGASSTVAHLGVWTFRLFAIGGIVGGIVLRRRRVPVFPLVAPIVTVVVTVALLYSTTRFRAPADLALAMLSAVALDAAWNAVRDRWRARRATAVTTESPSSDDATVTPSADPTTTTTVPSTTT
jgi:4-amino-4-deoxy-L-arabinose transferase-like glycosyltransferase